MSPAARPLRLLLVDDEELARLRLRQLLAEGSALHPAVEVVGEADDAASAQAWLAASAVGDGARRKDAEVAARSATAATATQFANDPVDALLLDIGLPGLSGLQLAQALRALARPPAVVFVTAHAEHALQAFDLDAVDYLTKPVRRERLHAALAKVARQRAAAWQQGVADAGADASGGRGDDAPPVLVVNDRGRIHRVAVDALLYCKAELKYVTLVGRDGSQWLHDAPLSELEARLGPAFMRVHRNALVRRDAVRALEREADAAGAASTVADRLAHDDAAAAERWVVRLANDHTLAVSRRQLTAVREALQDTGVSNCL